MPVLLFPDAAYFLVQAYRPVKNPSTGRVTYEHVGVKWVHSDLHDPVQREHAHNYYLSLCPWISQADRDKVASDWADIRHAREAEEKKREEMREAEEERRRRIDAMVEESEGVAMNIAKAERAVKAAGDKEVGATEEKEAKGWMDVVMG